MFEQTFKTQLSLLTNDEKQTAALWQEIETSYAESGRYYHNVSHLDNLLTELLPLKNTIQDWQTLLFSIAYHDIIYSIRQNDNEQKSAELARERLAWLGATSLQQETCFAQIMATKTHSLSPGNDTNLFTDADMAILGAAPAGYEKYAQAIRKEYSFYPDEIYTPGRQKVLQHFLAMPSIYKTPFFRDRYEAQARINLTHELEELSARSD